MWAILERDLDLSHGINDINNNLIFFIIIKILVIEKQANKIFVWLRWQYVGTKVITATWMVVWGCMFALYSLYEVI